MAKLNHYNRSASLFAHKLRKAGFFLKFDFVDDEWYAGVEVREGRFFSVIGYYSTPREAWNSIFYTHY